MSDKTDHSGMAALSICEALLLALNENYHVGSLRSCYKQG